MVAYLAECAVTKDLEPPAGRRWNARMIATGGLASAHPHPGWRLEGGGWILAVCELFKQQMIMAYDLMHQKGVDALDPDHAPPVWRCGWEYSTSARAGCPISRRKMGNSC